MGLENKTELLRDLFGAKSVTVAADHVLVDERSYPVIDGVIVLLDPAQWPAWLRGKGAVHGQHSSEPFAPDIQATFGAEWRTFPHILPEHASEFAQYFDVVNLETLRGRRVMDLGCGIGRWSYFLRDRARELVLVDFSEAVFVAKHNLRDAKNAIFFLGDLTRLPFRNDCADFVVCLGVLHHLPIDALDAVRHVGRYAPRMLIYLYSALDARPAFQRAMLKAVDTLRELTFRIDSRPMRTVVTWIAALGLYMPMIGLGYALRPFGLSKHVPLFDFYHGKSHERIRQDVYDKFFTRIEQRVTRQQIGALKDTFGVLQISEGLPQWHFLVERAAR